MPDLFRFHYKWRSYLKMEKTFIDVEAINNLTGKRADRKRFEEIIQKALEAKGLNFEESAMLLNVNDQSWLEEMYGAAKKVKEKIYGNRIVLFAPLYLSNYCVNNCLYCGFRTDNKDIVRNKLTPDEALEESKKLMEMGHKRVLLVAGEDTRECNLDYIKEIIDKIYEEKVFNGEIRRLNLNIAPLSLDDYKRLSTFGIGTIQVFQETYHPDVYKIMHPSGPKADYKWRLECMDRALQSGLNDVGMGALFGLTDFRFEVLALLMHSDHLLKTYGVGPHTLSIPRIEPADGSDLSKSPPHAINDDTFKKIVAVLRLSVPYTGMILTTRESAKMRAEVLEIGISQMSAGSKTNPGGYSQSCSTSQFTMADNRSINEIVKYLCEHDYMPSFCTSCYRVGRVGKDFMDHARGGDIHKYCEPNAISTFSEFLADYADEDAKKEGYALIERHMSKMQDSSQKQGLVKMLERVKNGERDIYN